MAFEVCMCRNPVGFWVYLVFLGLSGFICFFGLVNLRLLCVCAYGYEGTKV